MYQIIGEKIEVVVVYNTQIKRGLPRVRPAKFSWKNRTYLIDEITLATDTKDGGIRKRLYSVVSGGNVYRLSFNRDEERWMLDEMWMEG